jgi:hypothetical protein
MRVCLREVGRRVNRRKEGEGNGRIRYDRVREVEEE